MDKDLHHVIIQQALEDARASGRDHLTPAHTPEGGPGAAGWELKRRRKP
jgi:hypothetical protein